jgi:hypothetical protein
MPYHLSSIICFAIGASRRARKRADYSIRLFNLPHACRAWAAMSAILPLALFLECAADIFREDSSSFSSEQTLGIAGP